MFSSTVLVVGSGPVGLWLALELRRSNVDVLVIDTKLSMNDRSIHSKALTLSAGTLATFDSRGLASSFLAEALPMTRAHFGALETLLELNENVLGVRHAYNLAIPQAQTEKILLRHCLNAGVRFEWGLKFLGLAKNGSDGVVASAGRLSADGSLTNETIDLYSQWLVGCDGTHSTVRAAANIAFEGVPSEVTGVLADAKFTNLPPPDASGGWIIRRGPKGSGMIIRLGDGVHHRFVGLFTDAKHRKASEDISLDDIKSHLSSTFGSDLGVHSPLWLSRYGSACRMASPFGKGRVFLAGDAAHQMLPAGGKATQEENAGRKTVAQPRSEDYRAEKITEASERVIRLLDTYTTERHAAVKDVIDNVLAQMALLVADKPHENAIRSVFSETLKFPDLNGLWARRVTGFGEPTAPFHLEGQGDETLIGTRLTHMRVGKSGDDLFNTMSLDHFVLLLRQDSADDEKKYHNCLQKGIVGWSKRVTVLVSPTYSTSEVWNEVMAVLVRPDGRIAWVGRTKSGTEIMIDSLRQVLQRWFGEEQRADK
ncbi:Rifampicin monooxygenase [Cladobotryum mycophilum]|uniref:Rifampicin monooxygenase n=1 Tax=Cladobotryum mycophilum TaxID=491253 RepID=A0ABR0T099_9HYPO